MNLAKQIEREKKLIKKLCSKPQKVCKPYDYNDT